MTDEPTSAVGRITKKLAKRGLVWVGKKSLTETVVAFAAENHIFGQKIRHQNGQQEKEGQKLFSGKIISVWEEEGSLYNSVRT